MSDIYVYQNADSLFRSSQKHISCHRKASVVIVAQSVPVSGEMVLRMAMGSKIRLSRRFFHVVIVNTGSFVFLFYIGAVYIYAMSILV
jgi:hypothetical protein